MKRLVFLLSCLALISTPAFAQVCSDADQSTLTSCITDNTNKCLSETPQCDQFEATFLIEAVTEIAVTRCCSKKNTKSRKKCLKNEQRRYSGRSAKGDTDRRTWFRTARDAVKSLQTNDCFNNSYTGLF